MLKLFTYMVAWWWSIDIEYPATVKSFCTLKFALNMDIEQQTWIRGAFYIHAKGEGGSKSYPSFSQYHLVAIQSSELHICQVLLWPLLNSNSVEWIWKVQINLYQIVHRFVGNKYKDRFFFRPAPNLKRVEDREIYCEYISQCLLVFWWECA